MKYCGETMTTHSESEVESLLMSPCWNQGSNNTHDQFILEEHKLFLDHDLESIPSDSETQKNSLDVLDTLLNSQGLNTNLAELKPLPPFTRYTGHLSINGIPGHHYHTIAQRLPEENNNYSINNYQIQSNQPGSTDQNIVSSSTCLPDSVLNSDSESCLRDVKLFSDNAIDSNLYSVADSCAGIGLHGPDSVSGVRIYADSKELEYDMSSIEDIAAIIGSAIADTTVNNNQIDNDDGNDTRDSWMDLDAFIEGACIQQDGKLVITHNDSLNEYILPNSPAQTGSALQNLLTHGYMPLLQNRLQNGPPIKTEAPSSTSFCGDMMPSSASPPGSVCSTTDNLMLNNRYMQSHQAHHFQAGLNGLKADGLCSPDLMGNYPHTTTASTPSGSKQKRARHQKKSSQNQSISLSLASQQSVSVSYQSANDISGLLGKEKPVHRCNICNRGFLNKSNIKVHLRTHTGEKPFRCEVCSKAFRQKAHLIKHQQIHKRIGRD